MNPTHPRELLWFRQANSNPPPGFYAFKDRYLRRFATRAGWDKQTIEHDCWSCDGTGVFFYGGDAKCHKCFGSGVYRTTEHWLERWDLGGAIFHRPASWNEVPWPRPVVVDYIEGRIKHDAVSQAVARRAFRRLLLRHEPVTFYRWVVDDLRDQVMQFRARWAWRLIRLRNNLELFPCVENQEVPF